MFQSNVRDAATLLVFVRVARPAAEEIVVPSEAADPGVPFHPEELARFRRLKAEADRLEREERYQTMISRQLDRLGVEIVGEQRRRVIEVTLAYRDETRMIVRSESTEERVAALEKLRTDYQKAVWALVSPADAEKVVEALGRTPSFGRGRGDAR